METTLEKIYRHFLNHPEVSTDSRQVTPGSLFFALKGDSFNGNEFASLALDAGASVAIIDDARYAVSDKFIVVENVLETLQQLALHHRMQFDIPVIGITGTNGKTTTKELIYRVLAKKFNTIATRGNLNNHIGVPLTLLRINSDTQIAIVEMGANHPGEIDFLCRIASPGYGLITNVGKAHLAGFGNYEGVVRTKTELYRFLNEKKGTIFLNNSDNTLAMHANFITTVTYGNHPAEVALLSLGAAPYISMELMLRSQDKLGISTQLYGSYNAPNILAAVCVGVYFGVPSEEIKMAVESYQPENNRSQIAKTGRNLLIMDAYNANPDSMAAAIETFADSGYPDKTVILGDMLELGDDTDPEHLKILQKIDQMSFNQVYLIGPVFTRLNVKRENTCFQDTELAAMWLEHHRVENSTILIKGSRGIRLEKLIPLL